MKLMEKRDNRYTFIQEKKYKQDTKEVLDLHRLLVIHMLAAQKLQLLKTVAVFVTLL